MSRTIFSRPGPYLVFGDLPTLPIYFRSTGTCLVRKENIYCSLKSFSASFVELIWGLEGIGEISLYGQKYQIKPNHVFYYMPGEEHSVRNLSEEWRYRWLSFDGPLAEAIMFSFHYPRLQRVAEYPAELFARLEELSSAKNDPTAPRKICGVLMNLIIAAGIPSGDEYLAGSAVSQCLALIRTSLDDPALDVMLLSGELNLPRSTLSKQFLAKMGVPIGRFIRDQRLHLARSLLRNTTLPIKEIARRCGFSDPCTFTRFIKRSTGLPPREFRTGKQEES